MKIKRTVGIIKSLLSGARSQIFATKAMPLDPDDDLSLMEFSLTAELEVDDQRGEEPRHDPRQVLPEELPTAPTDEVPQEASTPHANLPTAPIIIDLHNGALVDAGKDLVDNVQDTWVRADDAVAQEPASSVEMIEDDDLWEDAIAAAVDQERAGFAANFDEVDDEIWPDHGAGQDDEDDHDRFEDMVDDGAFAFDPVFAPATPPPPPIEDAVDDWRIDRRALDLAVLLPFQNSSAAEAALPRIHLLLETFPHAASHGAMLRLAGDGATLRQIEHVAEVKADWRDSPHLWLHRRRRSGGIWLAEATDALRDALTWRVAAQLLEDRAPAQVLDLMHGDWLERWLADGRYGAPERADRDQAFFSFAAWLAIAPDVPERVDEACWPYDGVADRRDHRRRSAVVPGFGRLLQGPAPDPWHDALSLRRPSDTSGNDA
jgi:hypothetical protein